MCVPLKITITIARELQCIPHALYVRFHLTVALGHGTTMSSSCTICLFPEKAVVVNSYCTNNREKLNLFANCYSTDGRERLSAAANFDNTNSHDMLTAVATSYYTNSRAKLSLAATACGTISRYKLSAVVKS